MKEILKNAIKKALEKLNAGDIEIEINKPTLQENGDYSSNIAMKLARVLKKNPLEIANEIVNNISDDNITKVEVKAPGFINFFVSKNYLFENINKVLEEREKYGSSNIGNGKKINIEFVSANPTGILHLGNARGGAYGDSLARIMRFSGFDVTTEYYINDLGNQITNLGLSILARYKEICGIESSMPENGYYGKEIIAIAQRLYEEHQDTLLNNDLDYFKKLGTNEMVGHIFDDLKEYRIEYDIKTSEKALSEKYDLMGVVDILTKNGYTYNLDGATWFKCSALFDDKDHVLVKEDGVPTYFLPDIAYHMDKFNRGYDKMIDIFGADHHGYVARLKSSVKALGNDPEKLEVKLLQLVRLVENGEVVKMSKRTGKSVTLKELIDEVGVNAARYYFSKYSLDTQMDFDLNLAKSKSNENPVFYVCYAYARICSILKGQENVKNCEKYIAINDDTSYNVLEKVYEFPEVVKNAALKELPHLITNYVYELASLFHLYYAKNRVLTDNEQETLENLNLIKCVKQTIFNALNLIGKLKQIPKEELELMGYDDIALLILQESGKKMKLRDIFAKVINVLGLPEETIDEELMEFFELMSTNKKFVMLDKGYWDLQSRHKLDLVFDMEEDDEELENEEEDNIEEETEEDDDIFYDKDDETDDVAEDDLADLVVVDDIDESNL